MSWTADRISVSINIHTLTHTYTAHSSVQSSNKYIVHIAKNSQVDVMTPKRNGEEIVSAQFILVNIDTALLAFILAIGPFICIDFICYCCLLFFHRSHIINIFWNSFLSISLMLVCFILSFVFLFRIKFQLNDIANTINAKQLATAIKTEIYFSHIQMSMNYHIW